MPVENENVLTSICLLGFLVSKQEYTVQCHITERRKIKFETNLRRQHREEFVFSTIA